MTTTPFQIAGQLRDDINEGTWPPGTPLRQEDLGRRYGASRIPVREALQILGAEGLVRMEPNRGAVVAALDESDVVEIFELRLMIETHLLRAATPLHDARSVARLEAAQTELEHEDTVAGWLAGDRRFHEILYAPAARPRSVEYALLLRGQVERFAMKGLGPKSRYGEWRREHRALIAAVRGHDARAATGMLKTHLEETMTLVLRHLHP